MIGVNNEIVNNPLPSCSLHLWLICVHIWHDYRWSLNESTAWFIIVTPQPRFISHSVLSVQLLVVMIHSLKKKRVAKKKYTEITFTFEIRAGLSLALLTHWYKLPWLCSQEGKFLSLTEPAAKLAVLSKTEGWEEMMHQVTCHDVPAIRNAVRSSSTQKQRALRPAEQAWSNVSALHCSSKVVHPESSS